MFTHPTEFRHYIQLYKDGTTTYPRQDIESTYFCRFVSMKNTAAPALKNVYTESFAEQSGCNVWTPSKDALAYDASDVTLTLRWRSDECDDVLYYSDKFFDYVSGRKLEYHDTFRSNLYWQLILIDAPNIVAERLYGSNISGRVEYRFVEYRFKNFGGKPASTSQIK